ncbi:hypothetical protein KAR91_03615 [Candidatus Pacearchaeota archaeon]|nr:hypothetical protein [Candidatus Pacearchaeota archaeon]
MKYKITDEGSCWLATRDDPNKKGTVKFAKDIYPEKSDVDFFIKQRWHD